MDLHPLAAARAGIDALFATPPPAGKPQSKAPARGETAWASALGGLH